MTAPRAGAAGAAADPDLVLVFFDGSCGLCTGLVAWALARDRAGRLRAVPAQSDEARARSGVAPARLLEELHVWSDRTGTRSGVAAIAALLAVLPGWAWLARVVGSRALRPLADPLYRLVARNRTWFGAARCALPPGRD